MTHSASTPRRPMPWYGWMVGIIGLLWNAMGVILWAGTTFAASQFLSDLPPAHRSYVESLPLWSTFTWGLGVVGGLAGSVLLLLRSKKALSAYWISLVGALSNTMVYLTNPAPEGFVNFGLTAFIIGYAVIQVFTTKHLIRTNAI